MNSKDIDLFEVNEAFAAVVLRYLEALNISEDKVNVNGGSIAMGHPLGATGSMLLGTLLDELEKRFKHRTCYSLCRSRHGYCNYYRKSVGWFKEALN